DVVGIDLDRRVTDEDVVESIELRQGLIALDSEVRSLFDRLSAGQQLSDLQLRLASESRVPEERFVDRPILQVLFGHGGNARPHHADAVFKTGLLHRAGNAGDVGSCRALEALEVW